jgi:hypothetical protein
LVQSLALPICRKLHAATRALPIFGDYTIGLCALQHHHTTFGRGRDGHR